MLKRPYDGCGVGAEALLRGAGLAGTGEWIGEEMTCRVDYVLADAVLLQIGPPRGFS